MIIKIHMCDYFNGVDMNFVSAIKRRISNGMITNLNSLEIDL